MNRLNPSELQSFLRKYRFPGGRIQRLQLKYRRGVAALHLLLKVRSADDTPVKLKLQLDGVDEYGTYDFHCTPHLAMNMKGKVTVQ